MEEEIKTLRLQNQALRKLKARTRSDYRLIFFLTVFFVVGLALICNYSIKQMNEQITELQKHKFAVFDEPMLHLDKHKYLYYCGCESQSQIITTMDQLIIDLQSKQTLVEKQNEKQSSELIKLYKYIDDIHVNCLVGLVGGA